MSVSREHSVKVSTDTAGFQAAMTFLGTSVVRAVQTWAMIDRIARGEWERRYRVAMGLPEWDPSNEDIDRWRVESDRRSRARRYLDGKRRERRWSGVCFTVAVACIVVITERVTG